MIEDFGTEQASTMVIQATRDIADMETASASMGVDERIASTVDVISEIALKLASETSRKISDDDLFEAALNMVRAASDGIRRWSDIEGRDAKREAGEMFGPAVAKRLAESQHGLLIPQSYFAYSEPTGDALGQARVRARNLAFYFVNQGYDEEQVIHNVRKVHEVDLEHGVEAEWMGQRLCAEFVVAIRDRIRPVLHRLSD